MKSSLTRKQKAKYLFRRIYLLLWKNVLFRKRHYMVTTFEIILPTILAGILAFLRTQLDEGSYKVVDRISMFPPTTEQELLDYTTINILCNDCVFAYAPANNLTDEILRRFKDKLPESEFGIKGFANERALEEFAEVADLKSAYDDPKLKSAIVFDGFDEPDFVTKALNGSFPKGFKVRYRIRPAAYDILTENIFQWFQFPGPELENAAKYTLGGHSGVQILIDRVLIEMMTGIPAIEEIQTQVFPYPPYIEVKDFSQFYFIFLPLFLVLGFIFIVPSTIRNVVSERESGIKELMKLMGLPNWMHWLGWMMNSLLALAFSITIVIFLLFYPFNPKTGAVIAYSNPLVWWLALFLFVMAATSFCFFISTFSERPTLATTLGVVIWLVSYFGLVVPLEANYMNLTLTSKLASALIPNIGLHWIIKVMCGFEGNAAGAKWSNFFEPLSAVDGLSVGNICGMFIVDVIVYSLLTLYVEAVIPTKYGIRRPWYFLLKPSTWIVPKQKVEFRRQSIYSLHESTKPGFETEPDYLNTGVVIHKLTKKFGKKIAVNDISMKMYEGQITALLGHNGAGKTTTMSMLTGLFPPSSGNAYLSGFDIKHQLDEARESLGLCPQHNMLFEQLTVMEHLVFFGRIKGLHGTAATKEARSLLKKLKLNEKKHVRSMNLSGGQKRKLCLGMALIGGTKVVILDEPTSGMDPEARRGIWDLLLEMRGKRTIILTTHFMEEADILGDRVAIMSHGKIECYGTPMFLKKFYGTGYTLKMTVLPKANPKEILGRVQRIFPKAFPKTERLGNMAEIAIVIPSEENTTAKFPSMFLELNNEKDMLGILNIGLSLTTMDEVFIKIGEQEESSVEELSHSDHGQDKDGRTTMKNGTRNGSRARTYNLKDEKLSGLPLLKNQVVGLVKKKMLYAFRKRKLLLTQFLISPLLVIGAIFLSQSTSNPATNSPPLKMSLKSYQEPQTLFYAENDTVADIYIDAIGGKRVIQVEDDLEQELVRLGAVDLGKFRQEYIVGAHFNESLVTALFSSIPYHAAPLSVNLVTNTLLRAHAPKDDFSIEVTVHPLQNELFNILEAAQPNAALWFFAPIIFGAFVPIGLSLFAASYIVFPIEERTSKAKQLQLMTGVNTLVFWGTSFLWDLLLILTAVFVIILCFPIFETDGTYTSNNGILVLILVLVVWGYSSLSFAYFFSFIVSTPAGGFALKTVINIIFGMLLPFVVFVINNFKKDLDTNVINYVARFIPTFGASASIMRFASLAKQNSRCAILSAEDKRLFCNPDLEVDPQLLQCCDNCANFTNPFGPSCFTPESFMNWTYRFDSESKVDLPGIPQEVFWMLVIGIFYQLLFILIEFGDIRRCIWYVFCRTAPKRFGNLVKDQDVLGEKARVKDLLQNGRVEDDGFVVTNLSKSYGNFAAVANLNFGVHHGECFGLLGVNGAGKTTTFKMITGDEVPSSGNAYGYLRTLRNHRKAFLANIGYCPQFDASIGVLTGREMLTLFATLRGIPTAKIDTEVTKWLKKLGLLKAGNVKSDKYSGGMRRRLSVGIAMIGDPPIVLLDEPTSGVDPVARRQFWDVINSLKGSGQCVILTSHSMEECEALCSRLGIMVNGQLQCLGGVQHLKSKFAKGFSLVLRLKQNVHSDDHATSTLKKDILQKLSPCELKDEHQNVLQYQILNTEMPWNLIFEIVEQFKLAHNDIIEDYSVCETTLEEVFLAFARKQYQGRQLRASWWQKKNSDAIDIGSSSYDCADGGDD